MSALDAVERPAVMVQRPHVRRRERDCVNFGDVVQQAGAPRRFANTPLPWFEVWCTEHELVEHVDVADDDDVDRARVFSCYLAAKHARQLHDDDVDRDGWT